MLKIFKSKEDKNKEAVVDYYNSNYFLNFPSKIFNIGLYDNMSDKNPQENFVSLLAEKIDLRAGDNLIDIGCGSGGAAEFLANEYSCKVKGVTISKKQMKDGKKIITNKRVKIQLGDAHDLPFSDGTFDKAICLESAFHFFDKKKFCEEAFRVLSYGGKIAIADLTMNSQPRGLHGELMKCISVDDWKTHLKEAGFKVREVSSLGAKTFEPSLKYFSERKDLLSKFPKRHLALLNGLKILSKNYSKGNSDYALFVAEKVGKK